MIRNFISGVLLLLFVTSCDQSTDSEPELEAEPKIKIEDVVGGDGPIAETGTLVSITYMGKLPDKSNDRQ